MSHGKFGSKRFHDDMLKPKKRPRLGLPILVAAHDYKKKAAAAVEAPSRTCRRSSTPHRRPHQRT